MVCIYCGSPSRVTNSRLQKRLNRTWRRRQCGTCGNAFTTHEQVELESAVTFQSSATDLQPFRRDVLFISIYESCKHRPGAADDAAALVQTVLGLLRQQLANGVLARAQVIETVAAVLERFDASAATMYRAYHPA